MWFVFQEWVCCIVCINHHCCWIQAMLKKVVCKTNGNVSELSNEPNFFERDSLPDSCWKRGRERKWGRNTQHPLKSTREQLVTGKQIIDHEKRAIYFRSEIHGRWKKNGKDKPVGSRVRERKKESEWKRVCVCWVEMKEVVDERTEDEEKEHCVRSRTWTVCSSLSHPQMAHIVLYLWL